MKRFLRRLLGADRPQTEQVAAPLTQADLDRTLARLTNDLADLRLQWAEILDKIQRWASRQAKRDALDTKRRLESLEPRDQPPGEQEVPPPPAGDLRGLSKAELRHLATQRGLFNRGTR